MGVTQHEIARIVGLSRSTVSTILAGKSDNYSAKTRAEVLETARRLKYRPDRQALILKTGKSGAIGVVHTGSILHLVHQKISAVVKAIQAQHLEPLVYHNSWFENSAAITDMLLANRVQGVVFINNCYEGHSTEIDRLCESVPVVQYGGFKCRGIPLVAPNKGKSIEDIVIHLVQEGHRQIFMMASSVIDCSTLNPVTEFLQVFKTGNLGDIRHEVINLGHEAGDISDPYAAGARSLDILKGLLQGPAAVIAHNDNYAVGLYLRCLEEGIRVPRDLAITGWDNGVLGRRFPFPLTTVELPTTAMAQRSIEIVLQKESNPDLMELFPCQLIVRSSSRNESQVTVVGEVGTGYRQASHSW